MPGRNPATNLTPCLVPTALDAEIAAREAEIVSLCQGLIRIPTVNPPGDAYEPCARLLGDRLAARGFAVEYVRAEGAPGDSDRHPRVNVIARREGAQPGPCVHFNGHTDVVEVGHGWTVDPFGGEVADGKVWGRGACDMKGGIAAMVVACEALLDLHPDLPGAIEISGTVDEESGGYGGVGYLAKRGYFSKPRVDHVIIPEPLNVDRVCLGHRGVWWAELETKGRIAHGSMPFLGDCAVRHMGALLHAIETDLLPRLAAKRTAMPVAPEGARASTLNVNSIHGGMTEEYDGLPAPCVPDSCRMVVDRRYLIEEDPEEVKAEITNLIQNLKNSRPGFDCDIREVLSFLPTMIDAGAPVPRALSAEIERVLGRPAQPVVSPGTFDQKHVVRIGHLEDCVAYGPGVLDLAHQPDEWVGIADMVASAQVMAGAAKRLLKGAP